MRVVVLLLFTASFCFSLNGNEHIPVSCYSALEEVSSNYFKDNRIIEVKVLKGGYSNYCLLLTADKKYVLKVKKGQSSINDLNRELFAMQEAAVLTIAPHIYYVTKDHRAVLMEYIPSDTLNNEQSRQPENIKKIAQALYKGHTYLKNPYIETTNGIEATLEVYQTIENVNEIQKELAQAVQLIHECDAQLTDLGTYHVNIHGDLNPRNIFLKDNHVIIIDWEYTGQEDPFMDLSMLALRLNYNDQEEMLFLENYLQHSLTKHEIDRYYTAKKFNFAELTIYFFYFSQKWHNEGHSLEYNTAFENWEWFTKDFIQKDAYERKSLSQYYYDFGRCCLKEALKIKIEE